MQFIKTRDVKNPERNVAENAGIDVYIPNKDLPYLNFKDLSNIANEFGDNEMEFRVGAYKMIIGFIINNEDVETIGDECSRVLLICRMEQLHVLGI